MCGIAGFINYTKSVSAQNEIRDTMLNSMLHRGPDANGVYVDERIQLMHARLSIMDVERGKQPMHYGKYVMSYNGELYGFHALKQALIKKGYTFDTTSDSEVLLKAYAEYKEDVVHKINGIYAFAIWDKEANSLFLARDRLGVKPLFYAQVNDNFVFASEIKTMLKHPDILPIMEEDGLSQILLLGPARQLGKTPFRDIFEIKPGECATLNANAFDKSIYWSLKAKKHTHSLQQTKDHLYRLLRTCTMDQLDSDVGVCCFLSGGLDSSLLSKIASEKYKGLETFSVEYEDNEKYFKESVFQPNRDNDYIQMMVEDIGSKHTQFVVSQEEVVEALLDSTLAKDLPGMAEVDSSLLWFCKQVKRHKSVALSGEGADEIFGGYPWYYNDAILYQDRFPWSADVEVRLSCVKKGVLDQAQNYVDKVYYECIKDVSCLQQDGAKDIRMREMFVMNMRYFMQTLLERKDRMSMHSALEVRVPFLDYRLVEYAYNIPWRYKSLNGREKGILREAFKGYLPNEITHRKKSPYPKTHHPLYTKKVIEKLREILKKDCLLSRILDVDAIEQLMNQVDTLTTPWYGQLMRGPQIIAYFVQMHYFFEKYNVEYVKTKV